MPVPFGPITSTKSPDSYALRSISREPFQSRYGGAAFLDRPSGVADGPFCGGVLGDGDGDDDDGDDT